MLWALILISTIFTTNSLHTMEIIKKNKNKATYAQKSNHDYPIATALYFTYNMHKNNILPCEVTKHIFEYSIKLINKELFNNSNSFMTQWHLYCIPTGYHHLLTLRQIKLTQKLFTSERMIIDHKHESREYCILKSDKDYQLFLTLPIGLRVRLTQLPSSTTIKKCKISTDTILIKKKSYPITDVFYYGYIQKPIIPEEKKLITINKK